LRADHLPDRRREVLTRAARRLSAPRGRTARAARSPVRRGEARGGLDSIETREVLAMVKRWFLSAVLGAGLIAMIALPAARWASAAEAPAAAPAASPTAQTGQRGSVALEERPAQREGARGET